MNQVELDLIQWVKDCISKAERHQSNITQSTLQIHGMSSAKVRHLLNNICSKPDTRYLEVGCWKGSTLVSALQNNESKVDMAVAIDNFSEFGGPRAEFGTNCGRYLLTCCKFFDADCFSLDPAKTCPKPINVYFYDGEHSYNSQKSAFTHYNSILDKYFIAIVDDWNWEQVSSGTRDAFKELSYQVLYEAILPARHNGDVEQWWNGFYVAVIKKPD